MALTLKGVKTIEEAEQVVQGVTVQLQAKFELSEIKLEVFTENNVWYRAYTKFGKEVIIEVNLKSLDIYALMESFRSWTHIGKLNK